MEPSTGIKTQSVAAASTPLTRMGMRARYRSRTDPWKRMKTRIDLGKCATPRAVSASSDTTSTVAGSGRSSAARATVVVDASAIALAPSRALPHDFAEESLGPEDQDQDQERERDNVLVLRPERAPREQREVGAREGFEKAKDQASDHGARDVPDPTQDRRRERLEAGNEPGVGVDQAV